jgi:O-antigen/teichoic acid export membrane protein
MVSGHIKKISKDTFLIFTFNAVNYLSSFILAVLIARFLGTVALGEYSLIFALVSLLGIVSDFGLSTLSVRKINENKFAAKELIFNFNSIKILFSFLIFIIVFLTAFFFFRKIYYPAFFIGAALIFPRSLQSTYEFSLRSFLNQKYPAILKSINSLLQLIISYFLLEKGSGLAGIFICIFLFDILTLIAMKNANNVVFRNFISNNDEPVSFAPEHGFINKLFLTVKESYVFFLNNFLMLSIKSLNVILLGYFSSAASVGIYSAGSKFINGIGLFSGALFNSFYPAISNIKDNFKLKTGLAKKFVFYAAAAGSVITLVIFFLPEFIINLTFKISESVIVLKILSFTIIPVLVYTVTQSYLFSVYSEKFLLKILIIAWSLNIILSIVLIIRYDYTGCAIALSVTEIFLMVIQLGKFNFDIRKFEIQKAT